ncbi:MAG: S8 family serine peptidase, partial [Clostridia bacterium]|nr:S8 family serine peptidase [Clostridia bacterium]
DTYQDIFDSFADSDTVVVISSGNNSFWAEQTAYGHLYSEDFNYATDGSPGSYANALTVASVDNGSYIYATVGDSYPIILNEASGYGNDPYSTLADIELQYVILVAQRDNTGTVVAGVGSDEEFASIADIVEGKIAVCSRGSTSFYQKVDAAAANGAVGALIYNNTSGIINMNLTGLTSTIPAASITQDEGFALMELADESGITDGGLNYYVGTIVVHQSGDGEAKMSSFSSWGVPGDLSLKPEISAPGGSIYSVNGANRQYGVTAHDQYEMMSGTSMAAPQITGLAAVMGQFIRDNGLVEKTGMSPRQLINSLLMSTAIPEKDLFGSYYPVLQQGAGLANIEAATSAKSFITVDGVVETAPLSAATSIADGKVKVELGALTDDVVKIPFSIHNFSDEDVAYYLSADFFTQYLDAELRYEDTVPVDVTLLWTVNGEEFDAADPAYYDFNGDGVVNALDAQRILDSLVDYELDLNGLDIYADFDEDEDIDSYDARLAFEALSGLALEVEAGETVKVVLTVSGLEDEFGLFAEYGFGGNYIEGYIKVREGETDDGALGVLHSIPVLGFWGDWSEGAMFDKGSYIEYNLVEEPDIPEYMVPYMYYQDEEDSLYRQVFLVSYPGKADLYYLGGNPLDEEAYMPDRNAINSSTVVKSFYHTLIRNAGATRFFVTNKYGKIMLSSELGPDYAAYYYPNGNEWRSTVYNTSVNFVAKSFKEGDSFTINYQAIPEYFVDANGKAQWDLVNAEKTTVSLPLVLDNTAPFIVGSVYDEETGELVVSAHDNQYIAAVALYTEDGEFLDYYGSIEDIRKGEQYDYSFDLTELFEGEVEPHLLVEVYDYAKNLSTYKINLNPEELEDPELSVVVSPEEAVIINKGTAQLSATVYPWGYEDETVYWESEDEDIAVVDENGLVTSVYSGEEIVTVTITARSAVDETKFGTAEITILVAHKDLNGFIWDENGQVWLSEFDIARIPDYGKVSGPYNGEFTALTHGASLNTRTGEVVYDGSLYAATFDSENWLSDLYKVDPETFELTYIGGSTEIGYMDLCEAPSLGDNILCAVYRTYFVLVDATTGDYLGALDLSDYTNGAYLVGIAYEEPYYQSYFSTWTDYFWLLDEAGYVYNIGVLPYQGSYGNFAPQKLGPIANGVDLSYWQSLYYDYDGGDLYWARFESIDTNYVELVMVNDIYETGECLVLGQFADGVWPVSGLIELDTASAADSGNSHHSDDEIVGYALPAGSLKSIKSDEVNRAPASRPVDEIHKTVTEVTVEIRAEELTKNGQITVTIPETATLVSCESTAQYQALNIETPDDTQEADAPASGSPVNEVNYSTLRFAFVDLEGIEEDAALLTLKFAMGSTGTVIIETEDINDDDEQYVYETVILGVNYAYHEIHTYEAQWTWSSDDNGEPTATADLVCTLLDGAVVYGLEAEVTKEVKDDSVVYTATVEYEGKEYTDTKTVGIARVYGRSTNMAEELFLNFWLHISEDITADEDAYAVVTLDDEDYTYLLSECVSGNSYRILQSVSITQYIDAMTLRIYTGDDVLVTLYDKDGNDVTDTGYSFNMKGYMDLSRSSSDEKLVALAKAFEDYAAASMIYFDYRADEAPALSDAVAGLDADALQSYVETYSDTSLKTVVTDKASLNCTSKIYLNKYFIFEEGTDVSSYKFYINDVEVEATKVNATMYSVTVEGVKYNKLGDAISFKVTDGTNSYIVNYSVLSYCNKVLSSESNPAEFKDLVKSIALFYFSAADYFA